jgi:hypothetical protein
MDLTRSMQTDTGVDPRELLDAVDAYLVRYGGDFVPELVSSASGSRLYTVDGRCILDFTSGQMCATLGHNHPAIVAAIEKACREVIHLFSGMLAPPVVLLARELAGLLPPAAEGAVAKHGRRVERGGAAPRQAEDREFRGPRVHGLLARHDRWRLVLHLLSRPQGVRPRHAGYYGPAGSELLPVPDPALPGPLRHDLP